MKKYAAQILMIVAILAVSGVVYRFRHTARQPTLLQAPAAAPNKEARQSRLDFRATNPSPPSPSTDQPELKAPPKITAPQVEEKTRELTAEQQRLWEYWQRAAQQFEHHTEMLNKEDDSSRRMRLIQMMARNVRIDTLSTLDWAMGLENPAEQRAALNAINRNALVGIGARIKTDETGLPIIMNTTVLSAVASTGMVEPGDYISGIMKQDGSVIDFKDRPLRQIVQMLHGQPGTEVQLIMRRAPAEGQTESTSFNVPVQRSMIIMQPSFE